MKRQECFAYWKNRCAVCGFDYLKNQTGKLQAHHTPPGYKNLYHEDVRKKHLVPLCATHHVKGRLTYAQILWQRQRYVRRKILRWPFRMVLLLVVGPPGSSRGRRRRSRRR